MVENLQFTISSELKNIIGRDLITDDFIAILELVKNSYDAKAKEVQVIFEHAKETSKESKIIVVDNGYGMSKEDINDKWLLVGHSWKQEQEGEPQIVQKNEDYREKIMEERFFAGAKGIGRFSCDRLGKILKMYTKTENNEDIHVLEMDWDRFEKDPKKRFEKVDVNYYTVEKLPAKLKIAQFNQGMVLEISDLRSKWDWNKLVRLKRHLQRLINPTQISPELEFQIYLSAKEFVEEDKEAENDQYIINGFVKNFVFEKLEIKTTRFTSKIDAQGKKIVSELYDKGEFIYRIEEENEYLPLHNITIELFYLNPVAKREFTRTMGIQPVRFGSVFFYKNGIKINPYGNEGDDWLGLDRRKTQGIRRFLGNRDVMGRIEITGKHPYFREVSSRDGGVQKNPELDLLKKFFLEKVLRMLERYVVEGIDWDSENKPKDPEKIKSDTFKLVSQLIGSSKDLNKKIEFNEDLFDIYKEKQVEKTPQLLKNIESIKTHIGTKEEKAYVDLQIKGVRTAFRTLRKKQRDLEREVKTKTLFIEREREEKKEIQVLNHQLGLGLENIKLSMLPLKKKIEKEETILNSDIIEVIDNVLLQAQMMSSITSFITKAKFDLSEEEIEDDLAQFIKQYIERAYVSYHRGELTAKDVTIKVDCNPDIEFIRIFNPLEIVIIIDNLIDNSIKANATHIFISIKHIDNELELRIKDDGSGINKEALAKIYDFGFSTTGGSGIGLYHVKKILKEYGKISVNTDVDKGSEFIIRMDKE